jgi:hypothetical protein
MPPELMMSIQRSPLDGLHGAHRQPDLLPRPATKERGEGWGEGLPPVAYLADSSVNAMTPSCLCSPVGRVPPRGVSKESCGTPQIRPPRLARRH